MCLGQEDSADLRAVLRASQDDSVLAAAVVEAITRKPKGHDFVIERQRPAAVPRHMSVTGVGASTVPASAAKQSRAPVPYGRSASLGRFAALAKTDALTSPRRRSGPAAARAGRSPAAARPR